MIRSGVTSYFVQRYVQYIEFSYSSFGSRLCRDVSIAAAKISANFYVPALKQLVGNIFVKKAGRSNSTQVSFQCSCSTTGLFANSSQLLLQLPSKAILHETSVEEALPWHALQQRQFSLTVFFCEKRAPNAAIYLFALKLNLNPLRSFAGPCVRSGLSTYRGCPMKPSYLFGHTHVY